MAKHVAFSVFLVLNVCLTDILAGSIALQHRATTLDELKAIDSYVSSASDLPLLENGFFIGTSRGPVLVKSEPPPGANARPTVRSKYYNTLPRLIPAGFEGIAVSHFNLGAANPYKPLSSSKNLFPIPVAHTPPPQYIATHAAQPAAEQYVEQPVLDQSPQVYQHQQQQYVASSSSQHPQRFLAQSEQQYTQNDQLPQQFAQNGPNQRAFIQDQQSQQPFLQPEQQPQQPFLQNEHPQQQFIQNEQPQQQFIQNEQPQQQFIQNQQPQPQFLQSEQPQQQFLGGELSQRQFFPAEQPQQRFTQPEQLPQPQYLQTEQSQQQQQLFPFPQQYVPSPSQLISEQAADSQQAAQEPTQISASSQTAAVAEPSFQVDNLLRQEQDQAPGVTAFQTQVFGRERFHSQKLLRNAAVVATSDFEETLPELLRNRFYKNANLATILAQESLPVQGEQIINEWETNKIAKGKIHALLHGAGFI